MKPISPFNLPPALECEVLFLQAFHETCRGHFLKWLVQRKTWRTPVALPNPNPTHPSPVQPLCPQQPWAAGGGAPAGTRDGAAPTPLTA